MSSIMLAEILQLQIFLVNIPTLFFYPINFDAVLSLRMHGTVLLLLYKHSSCVAWRRKGRTATNLKWRVLNLVLYIFNSKCTCSGPMKVKKL